MSLTTQIFNFESSIKEIHSIISRIIMEPRMEQSSEKSLMLLRFDFIWTYAEGGHRSRSFSIVLDSVSKCASDQLLQLEESGMNAEQGGDGSDTDLGSLGGIEDQGEHSRQEVVAVCWAERRNSLKNHNVQFNNNFYTKLINRLP
jgi:hypothetical protein